MAVGDVKNRRHLVAVFRGEASGREAYGSDEVRIDDTETFLLAGSHEKRPVNLDAVDVD